MCSERVSRRKGSRAPRLHTPPVSRDYCRTNATPRWSQHKNYDDSDNDDDDSAGDDDDDVDDVDDDDDDEDDDDGGGGGNSSRCREHNDQCGRVAVPRRTRSQPLRAS